MKFVSSLHTRLLVASLLVVLLALAVGGFWTYRAVERTRHHLESLEQISVSVKERVARIQENPLGTTQGEIESLTGDVARAEEELKRVKREVGFLLPVTERMGLVPKVGTDISSLREILEASLAVASSARLSSEALQQVVTTLFQGALVASPSGQGGALGEDLFWAEGRWQEALDQLSVGENLMDSIDVEKLSSGLRSRVQGLQREAGRLRYNVDQLLDLSRIARRVLGVDEPKTYLLIAQSSDELRASGGFIAAAWLVSLVQGQIADTRFFVAGQVDDYSRPLPAPPQGLKRYLYGDVWVFRDTTWFPDFPISATTTMLSPGQPSFMSLYGTIQQRVGPVPCSGAWSTRKLWSSGCVCYRPWAGRGLPQWSSW